MWNFCLAPSPPHILMTKISMDEVHEEIIRLIEEQNLPNLTKLFNQQKIQTFKTTLKNNVEIYIQKSETE